jgi:hypothetical protein
MTANAFKTFKKNDVREPIPKISEPARRGREFSMAARPA